MKVLLYNILSMKRYIKLTNEQRKELDILIKTEKRIKIYQRLQFIDLKDKNLKNSEIQKIIPVSMNTLSDWTTLFFEKSFSWLCQLKYEWRRPWKLSLYKDAIKKHLEENIVSTINELKDWIEKEFSLVVQTSWLWEYLKKNWIFLTKKQKSFHENTKQQKHKKPTSNI